VVAPELVTTSITSDALPQERLDEWSAINPNLQFASSEHRGYLRLDVTPTQLRADLIAMESVKTAQSAARAVRSFVIEDGRPLPVPA
jgi:alkaline phosphatase D